jgi:transposase
MPEPPLDPPSDDPECPVCDAILHIATRQLASCGACGWIHEADWEMQDDQAD